MADKPIPTPDDLRKIRMNEPERRVLAARDSGGRPVADWLVTFTQVGWMVVFLDGDASAMFFRMDDPLLEGRLHQAASVTPLWVEGPNE